MTTKRPIKVKITIPPRRDGRWLLWWGGRPQKKNGVETLFNALEDRFLHAKPKEVSITIQSGGHQFELTSNDPWEFMGLTAIFLERFLTL